MEAYECPVCHENIYYDAARRMMQADVCGHRICSKCVDKQYQNHYTIACPICRNPINKDQWGDREPDQNVYDGEKRVRRDVNAVYNRTREDFANTPLYNDYLEEKEEVVYVLVYSSREEEKAEARTKLEKYRNDNATAISANRQKQEDQLAQKIRDIVSKEGDFYERVKVKFQPGFAPAAQNLKLTHRLKVQYSHLFSDTASQRRAAAATAGASTGSAGLPRPLGAFPSEDRPMPSERADYQRAVEAQKAAGGYSAALCRRKARQILYDPSKWST
ncbi:unnamed protein product [Vitrella brassicaformis CCMP3155]|uniref:RING-type domain-containing protein n=1 Tax=Vitrella brassicaformis (strain CCMP3155) TaxID=1169540 RepID=A0A0G4FP73_VITBC|nr:unnamed protein product [Vitrella brassicaformis CCMP3155]|eukprot:CEM16009.1 unnamed protein product [Vitrella brassicaformis CCMP3155]